MQATAPSSGSGLNALERAPHGAEVGPADREDEEDDRDRDADRRRDRERAAPPVPRHVRHERSRSRARHGRVGDDGHARSIVRAPCRGPPARVAADPSPSSRQARRPAREDCRVSSTSADATPRCPTSVGHQPPSDGAQDTGVRPEAGRRRCSRRVLETSPFPILLVCLVGIVLLSVFAPSIVVGDTWLTLMAGREVVENGLPHTEHLTVLGEGRTWTDQQWLAQVVFYARPRARRDARA